MAGTANTAADSYLDVEEDSGLPPCQAAARDPEGSFILAAAEGGGRDRVSATMFSSQAMCHVTDVVSVLRQVAQLSDLAS